MHHSAEVMTTLTELRQHPVEILAFINLIGIATGGVNFGAMTYTFGPGAHRFTLLNANIALMLFLMTWGHLRHSHIWLSFTGRGRPPFPEPGAPPAPSLDNPDHFNKNLGFALAVWDWVFGTLRSRRRSKERRRVRRRRDAWRLRYSDAHVRKAVRPFRRAPRSARGGSRGRRAQGLRSRRRATKKPPGNYGSFFHQRKPLDARSCVLRTTISVRLQQLSQKPQEFVLRQSGLNNDEPQQGTLYIARTHRDHCRTFRHRMS